MKRKLIDNRRKVEAKKRKRKPYGVLRTYNPKDTTVTIGGVEIKNWASFKFKTGEPDEITIYPSTTAGELQEDLRKKLRKVSKGEWFLPPNIGKPLTWENTAPTSPR